ncbi:ATP-binding cassette domain-containing protein [Paenibacillus sp. TAF43_2]|uniref:ATP-binding cassette domain-containing protein n=1 Tax=Paenibacillus sp. TAF43_2 TaxID=3233069 RepID=UPI003F972371
MNQAVLQIENLYICADKGKEHRLLVKDLTLQINQGETLALVGESGSGKSVTANAVLGMLPHHLKMTEGRILLSGEDISLLPEKKRRKLCGDKIGFVFQDYQGSFTPFIKIGNQLSETLRSHRSCTRKEAKQVVLEWLEQAGIQAERVYESYPFQLSGGQLQRAVLASAMMLEPALLIADEPTTALDVLAGERVLDLLAQMKAQTGCAVLLISHDLRNVLKRADTVAVMRYGQLLDIDRTDEIGHEASHPYTRMLLEAKPNLMDIERIHQNMAADELSLRYPLRGLA